MSAGRSMRPDVCVPVPSDPTVSFSIAFRVGSRCDPPGLEGLAYMTGLMVAQGATTEHSYETLLARLYPLAATYDVHTDKEFTTLFGRAHHETLDRYLPLLENALLRPAFTARDFRRLKEDAINDIETTLRHADEESLAEVMLHACAFRGSRYAHPPEGTIAGLRRISLDDVREFHRSHYVRAHAIGGIGGGFDATLAARFAAAVDALPGAPGRAEPLGSDAALSPAPAGIDVVLIDKPGADASISFGFPLTVLHGERDFYALSVANAWLGDTANAGSRLFQSIRELRGLNYGAYSFLEASSPDDEDGRPPINAPRRRQLFEVWIRTLPNEHAVFALRAALREIALLARHGLDAEQFELMRRFLGKQLLWFAETTEQKLGIAMDDCIYGLGDEGHLARFRRALTELTLDDVNRAIATHLQAEHFTLSIVTGDVERLRHALASGAPSEIRYASPKPQAVLDEDRQIAAWPLAVDPARIRVVPVHEALETTFD